MKNTVLVTADSVRADYCGFLGGPDTTPFLSSLAEESVVYGTAISPGPRTPSSIAPSLTGERFRTNSEHTNQGRLERIADHVKRFETVPEMFSRAGYSTGAVTANPWTTTATGFDELFNEFVEIGDGYGSESRNEERSIVERGIDYIDQWRKGTDWFAQWPSFYDDILELVETLPEPWFLWVFLLDTHSPYILPRSHLEESNVPSMAYSAVRYNASVMRGQDVTTLPPHLDRSLKRTYRDAIRSVDRFVYRLYNDVPDETNLLFHSDHGEAFGEHGTYGHQEQLYEENIRVPLLLYDGKTSERVDEPMSTLEIPSLLEQMADDELTPRSVTNPIVFSQSEFGEVKAARTHSHKFIQRNEESVLYDLKSSPDEQNAVQTGNTSVFDDAIDAEYATDREKSKVVTAVGEAEI